MGIEDIPLGLGQVMEEHPLGAGGNRILPTGTRKQEGNVFI